MSATESGTGFEVALPEVKMHLYTPKDPVVVKVVGNEVCTSRKAAGFTRHVSFDVSGTSLEGVCVPGQSIGVIPPGVDEHGKAHKVRLYSLSSPSKGEDGAGKVIATTVKRTIDEHWESHRLFLGVASNYLCDLQVGDEVTLTGPAGKRFILPMDRTAHDYLFFATGTGVAPFRGMVLDLLSEKSDSQIALVMGAPYATDLLYHAEFLALAEKHPNFHYITAISREKQPDGHDPMYVHDRIRTEKDRLLPMLTSGRTLVYICGVAGMELGVFQQLAERLNTHDLSRYLEVEGSTLGHIKEWTRRMIHREIKPTKRVFMEVYA